MTTLIDLINSFAKRDKVALKYSNGYRTFSYSYQDLYNKILYYGAYLQSKGLGPGDRALIWAPNSPEWVAAYFAIIAVGAVVVPIDYRSSLEHAENIIKSAEPRLKIISKFKKRLLVPDIEIENLKFDGYACGKIAALPSPAEDDLVELVYTSGTTGDPKGVMISHLNLLSNLGAVVKRINLSKNDRFLSVLPLSHLFEQTGNMLAPLFVGASVVYLSTLKPSAIFSALAKENITIFVVVPRLLAGMKRKIRERLAGLQIILRLSKGLSPAWRKRVWFFLHKKFGSSFRFFVSGGAALDHDTELFWRYLGFTIVQGYGLTECSPILSANSERDPLPGSVGKALDNVELALSPDKEIIARGPNIFSGYFRNPEKTARSFRDGWFLTGDVGEFDPDGNLYIRSRLKDVIVTAAGVNVYPEDIESVLNEVPGVKESAVIGKKGAQGEEVHAVIIADHSGLDIEKIIIQANKHLEESQLIKSFSLWEGSEFPKTSTLKIKKNSISDHLKGQESEKISFFEVDIMKKILCEVLSVGPDEISDDKKLYFNLMLDSIGRLELVAAIEREYNMDFDEENINLQTTVGDLRRLIKKQMLEHAKFSEVTWNYGFFAKALRSIFLKYLGNPLIRNWCRVKAEGLENLKGLKGPVIFTPNHQSYIDQAVILTALPARFRRSIATAALDEYFRPTDVNIFFYLWRRLFFYFLVLGWGIFPFSQTVNHKKSLEYIGCLVDMGNNILIFPEGERTWDGEMQPLKRGIDVLVNNLEIPVIPVGVSGLFELFPRTKAWPKKGKVTVRFGQPIYPAEFRDRNVMLYLGAKIRGLIERDV